MANLAEFVFLDASSTSTTSNTFYVPYGADEVVLQVKSGGAPAGEPLPCRDPKRPRDNGEFVPLAIIGMSDFNVEEKISENGIYSVAASGIREMQVVNGGAAGSVIVFGAAVGEG